MAQTSDEKTIAKLRGLLLSVVNAFETEGCDGCGTVDIATINAVREELGMEPLEDESDEEDGNDEDDEDEFDDDF